MLESDGNSIVRNYVSNFDVKEYIQNVMIPKAFPNIPMNKMNSGFTGIVSEYMAQAVEDVYGTTTLMGNESFITRAVLPNSIYSEAALFNIGYTFATPSVCSFALQVWIADIIKYSIEVRNTQIKRYRLDRDTKLVLGDNIYMLDYDVIIDHQYIDGQLVFDVYYDMTEINSVSRITNKYVKHQVSSIGWLVLFVDLAEFTRKTDVKSISDNLITVNSDIEIKWVRQIAGLDLVYISPSGERQPMKLKTQYTNPDIEPFVWYRFKDDQTIVLSFSSNKGYFVPEFNSSIEYTIYTCRGKSADFNTYDRKTGIPVQKSGKRYSYNATTKMAALCYGGSVGGLNRGDLELLRDDVILAHNTSNVLTSDTDLDLWFERYAKRYETKSKFFKRRDDPSGTLFSQFIAINDGSYTYPTNTLNISVDHDQFDHVNDDTSGVNQEFIIEPGHLWEYVGDSRDTVTMISGVNGYARITDESLPILSTDRPFMFVNPFTIKIHRNPMVSACYNCLINDTSWPEDIPINSESFYQFQLATFSIERSLSSKKSNLYKLQVICVPVVTTDSSMKYIEGIGEDYPKIDNNLRLVLVTRSKLDGETGYIEMTPVELRKGGSIVYEAELYTYDNIDRNGMIKIDRDRTIGMESLISTGVRKDEVYIDASETSFHFICLMKDTTGKFTSTLYGNRSFEGYLVANRFANAHRDLTLYKPLNMMKSYIEFTGENNNYHVNASLMPFLKYDIPLDDEKMIYFITAFGEQYKAMEPVVSKVSGKSSKRLEGNASIDFKLFNTYGRSNNYYIGPKDGDDILWNSDILLDNVYVRIKFRMAVYDRSLWYQTCEAVKNDIIAYFKSLDSGEITDIHSSDLIHLIIQNHPNVRYIRFTGYNDYNASKDSIFVKYDDISELMEDQLRPYVPEMIRVDSDSIDITEEV